MTSERLQEIKERYERMQKLAADPGPDIAAVSHACAISYSLDVWELIAEVDRLWVAKDLENSVQ